MSRREARAEYGKRQLLPVSWLPRPFRSQDLAIELLIAGRDLAPRKLFRRRARGLAYLLQSFYGHRQNARHVGGKPGRLLIHQQAADTVFDHVGMRSYG